MATASENSEVQAGSSQKKKIKVRKLTSSDSSSSSISLDDSDDYIPLAARDSKWVGLGISGSPSYKDDVNGNGEEVVIMEITNEEDNNQMTLPIYSLFPLLLNTPPDKRKLVAENEFTSDITKLLVGQKPDFTHMKKSKRFAQIKTSLPKLEEVPNEEKTSESRMSKISSRITASPSVNRGSDSSNSSKETHYDDGSDLENTKVKKRKRYRKRASVNYELDDDSSYSGINLKPKEPHAVSTPIVKGKSVGQNKIEKNSSNGSLADEESVSEV